MHEENSDEDREVASVIGSGINNSCRDSTDGRSSAKDKSLRGTPARASTVLTNVSRGNTSTVTPCNLEETIHTYSCEGEVMLLKNAISSTNIDELDVNGMTCLMWAASCNQIEIVHFLIGQGASVDLSAVDSGATALVLAAGRGHVHVVEALLEAGADPDIICKTGSTALLFAVHCCHADCVKLLLDWGADLAAENEDGFTALQLAIEKGHRTVQLLIENHILNQFAAN